ncbi:MAG: hypothetical protein LC796_05530 [Acidobacteria bacterium]|nr:hypothetical protein [Acidobacteriota bacterium]MCA1612134.1 hypothetical protein [Acidobacteriota bacterium]
MMNSAGPELDRQIERKLNGDAKKKTPPYSTSEKAANRLLRRLEMQDMPCTIEEIDGVWFCTFWILLPNSRERLSTGSGETRALAIARAVMNARLGMGASLSSAAHGMSSRLHWTQSSGGAERIRTCDGCGADLPARNREATNRFCTVCSWRIHRAAGTIDERKTASRPPVSAQQIPILADQSSEGSEGDAKTADRSG